MENARRERHGDEHEAMSKPIAGSQPTGLNPDSRQPLVCCVCLTRDRPEMLQRAITCFKAQTYPRRRLFILDTSVFEVEQRTEPGDNIVWALAPSSYSEMSLGELRNEAAIPIPSDAIIIHWDDDDWSHPTRIAEQVALLQASGKEAVGYREMLFWRFVDCKCPSGTCSHRDNGHWGRMLKTAHHPTCPRSSNGTGDEAWLFSSGLPRYCLGTSLCYWRSVWERRPFEDLQTAEDYAWLKGVDSLGTDSVLSYTPDTLQKSYPRMIASIHGGNTSPVYKREYLEGSEAQRGEWKRASAWDDYCRRTMEGECSSTRP